MDNLKNNILISPPAADSDRGMRLDRFLSGCFPEFSRSRIQQLVKSGCVSADDDLALDNSFRIRPGDSFTLEIPPAVEAVPRPENIPLNIVYEDADILVVDKPAGMTVHPAAGAWDGTLVNALLYHCRDSLSGIGGVLRPGIVGLTKTPAVFSSWPKTMRRIAVSAPSLPNIPSNALTLPWFTAFLRLYPAAWKRSSAAVPLTAKKWRWLSAAEKEPSPIIRRWKFFTMPYLWCNAGWKPDALTR